MTLIAVGPVEHRVRQQEQAWETFGRRWVKEASDSAPAYSLSGMLYLSRSNWLLLSVPNSLVRGVFSALDEPGLELPLKDGKLEAHVTVFSDEELSQIGAENITERGKRFAYRLGGLYRFKPDGWSDIAEVFAVRVHSPAMQQLRVSYGLTPIPHGGEHPFHITVGMVRKGTLGRNETAKGSAPA